MKRILYLIFFLLLILALGGAVRSWFQYDQLSKTQERTPKGIDRLLFLDVRGNPTGVLLRGKNITNPLLIMVHGGPGYPDMMLGRCFDEGLLESFTVVRYDQKGVGKSDSDHVREKDLNVANFVQDLLALTDSLTARFPTDSVYLLGHSWGSLLGIKAAHEAPEKYVAYIGMGQIVHEKEGDSISLQYTLDKAREQGDLSAIQTLESLPINSYNQDTDLLYLQRSYLKQFGGSTHNQAVMDELKSCVLSSPEMTLLEILKYQRRGRYLDKLIFPQLLKVNLFEELTELELPVYFFGGRHDYHVPSVLAKQYLDSLQAPRKEFIWFEKSGHMPVYEENKRFTEEVLRVKEEMSQDQVHNSN